jgi:hypothetical protein
MGKNTVFLSKLPYLFSPFQFLLNKSIRIPLKTILPCLNEH